MSKVGNYRVTIVTTCCTYCTNGQFAIRVFFFVNVTSSHSFAFIKFNGKTNYSIVTSCMKER